MPPITSRKAAIMAIAMAVAAVPLNFVPSFTKT